MIEIVQILPRHWLVRYGVTCEIAREGSSGSCKGFFERTTVARCAVIIRNMYNIHITYDDSTSAHRATCERTSTKYLSSYCNKLNENGRGPVGL